MIASKLFMAAGAAALVMTASSDVKITVSAAFQSLSLSTTSCSKINNLEQLIIRRRKIASNEDLSRIQTISRLSASADDQNENDDSSSDIWSQQKQLLSDFNAQQASSLKAEQSAKFQKRQLALVGDTAFFSAMIFCALWLVCDNPFVSISYSLGAILGLAYSYGLGKYVETIGASIDDEGIGQGAGIGNARFAFLILLFIFVGKFKSVGLLEIPAIMGFFTYQIGSLSQGLREIND